MILSDFPLLELWESKPADFTDSYEHSIVYV